MGFYFRTSFLFGNDGLSFEKGIFYGEDTLFVVKGLYYARRLSSVVEAIYYWRWNVKSTSSQMNSKRITEQIVLVEKLLDNFALDKNIPSVIWDEHKKGIVHGMIT